MERRPLGSSGLQIAPLGLGTDNFGNPTSEAESARILAAAIDAGIDLVDTANVYAGGECERIIGRALAASGRRDDVVLATKAFYPTGPGPEDRGLSRAALLKACDASLARLGVDHIDLYQLHRPDFDVPIEETLGALAELRDAGKIRFAGSSTAPAWKIREAMDAAAHDGAMTFISEQAPYNLLDRRMEQEVVPLAAERGLGLLCWSPMAMGMLAGRYTVEDLRPQGSRAAERGGIYAERVTREAVETGVAFTELAAATDWTPAQLAVLWVMEQPGVTAPLIGPKSVEQLDHLTPLLGRSLPDDLRAACDALVAPGTWVANFHNSAGWPS